MRQLLTCIIPLGLSILTATPSLADSPRLTEIGKKIIKHVINSKRYCDSNRSPAVCKKHIDKALQNYARAGENERYHPEVIEAKKYINTQIQIEKYYSAKSKKKQNKNNIEYKFSERMSKYTKKSKLEQTFKILSYGERATTGGYLDFVGSIMKSVNPDIAGLTKSHRQYIQGPIHELSSLCKEYVAKLPSIKLDMVKFDLQNDRYLCKLALNANNYLQTYFDLSIALAAKKTYSFWNTTIDTLDKEGSIYIRNYDTLIERDRFFQRASKDVNAITIATGTKAPSDFTATLNSLHERFKTILVKRSKMEVWNDKIRYQDDDVEDALERNADERNFDLEEYGSYKKVWDVYFNTAGLPTNRRKSVTIMVEYDNEDFCRVYDLVAVQNHIGGGNYSDAQFYNSGFNMFYVSKCKSFF